MRVAALENTAADIFAQSQPEPLRFGRPNVQLASLAPQTKFTGADVSSHAFRRGALEGQFEIVNRCRAVHGDVVDEAAFHQIDDVPVHSGSNHMRTDDHYARRAGRFRADQPRRHRC